MPIWFYDKEKDEPSIYGSLRAISMNTTLKESLLYKHFSVKQKNGKHNVSYEDDQYEIHKLPLIRSKKKT
jgi:hypothetical protein